MHQLHMLDMTLVWMTNHQHDELMLQAARIQTLADNLDAGECQLQGIVDDLSKWPDASSLQQRAVLWLFGPLDGSA